MFPKSGLTEGLLCNFCKSISWRELLNEEPDDDDASCKIRHQPSYLALKRSAVEGCKLCSYIWAALAQSETNGEPGISTLIHVSERYPGKAISLSRASEEWLDEIYISSDKQILDDSPLLDHSGVDPAMHPNHPVPLNGSLDVFAYPDDHAALHGGVRGRPLPISPGNSEEDFALIRDWLHNCLSNHKYCPKNSMVQLPTRVLDVADMLHEPFLVETGKELIGCYTTLSHCWGGCVPLTTTTENLETHKQSVPLSSMPATFRDAVLVTRRLGIQYLWIDSLCILQNSAEDWGKESVSMGEVYGQSFLTIAATGASKPADGCFIARPKGPSSCRLTYQRLDNATQGAIYVQDPAFRIELIGDSPLDCRGWFFQERMLSPRILYYGTQQLSWECIGATARQSGKCGTGNLVRSHQPVSWKEEIDFRARILPIPDPMPLEWKWRKLEKVMRMRQWYQLLDEYNTRQLQFDSDKLPAIAGIAKEFHKSTGYSYVAGLWQEDILDGILWSRRMSPCSPPISKHLPSWSWARFNGPITFSEQVSLGSDLEVLDGTCKFVCVTYRTTDGLENYGNVSHACITLHGRVIPTWYWDCGNGEHKASTTDGTSFGSIKFDIEPQRDMGNLFCLLVGGGEYRAAGLLLQPIQGQGSMYRRIGYVSIPAKPDDQFRRNMDGRVPFWRSEPKVLSIE